MGQVVHGLGLHSELGVYNVYFLPEQNLKMFFMVVVFLYFFPPSLFFCDYQKVQLLTVPISITVLVNFSQLPTWTHFLW